MNSVKSNGYLYLIEELKTINKISLIINEENENIIPYLNKNEDIEKLVNEQIIIGYRKPLISFYGYATIKKVITKSNNKKVYDKYVELYKLDCPSNLYFFELDEFIEYKNVYEEKIHIKDLNYHVDDYELVEIKFPKKMGNFEIEKNHSIQIIKMIKEIYKDKELPISQNEDGSENSEYTEDTEDTDCSDCSDFETSPEDEEFKRMGFKLDNEDPDKVIVLKIPILWIPCSNLKLIIKKEKITKNILHNHYRKCEHCEVVNNNNNDPEFGNIVFSYKNDESEEEMNEIIKYYKFLKNYVILREDFIDNKYETGKLNILYYENDCEYVYDECIFILYNKQ